MQYLVHYNGGFPYKVVKDSKGIKIFKYVKLTENKDIIYSDKPIYETKSTKIFVGKSVINKMTKFSGAMDNKSFDGNTILIDEGDNKYIFVGYCLFSFVSLDKITQYYSPVGNNLVPYPYAVDKKNNVYLLFEDLIILGGVPKNLLKLYDEPYDYYYNLFITHEKPEKVPIFSSGVNKFYIGSKRSTLPLQLSPGKSFDEYKLKLYAQIDNKKELLTREKYISLMKKCLKLFYLSKLKKRIIHKFK
jgi:hypothetical protein